MSRICLVCGKETEKNICSACRETTDIEKLCNDIIAYTPRIIDNPNANPVWEKAAEAMDPKEKFSTFAFELAEELDSPRREYQKIHSFVGKYTTVDKLDRPRLYSIYESMSFEGLSDWEIYWIKGLVLEALYSDHRYFDAEIIADEIVEVTDLPWQTFRSLIDFYIRTRRYEVSEEINNTALGKYKDDSYATQKFEELATELQKRKTAGKPGNKSKEYMPSSKEDKEKYIDFMNSIGIDIQKPVKEPEKLPKEGYPEPEILKEANFDTFVAYDFETTGRSTSKDSIIEIGAIKVVNGEIVESEKFIFNEFVKPYKKALTKEVSDLTGITKEDVMKARKMWEVTPKFMEFVGDSIMVGFNNAAFDSKFLARAGRYSRIYITNKQFDIYQFVKSNKAELNYDKEDTKLNSVAEFYGIENPQAHRALADAITTARIYLEIRKAIQK